MFLFSYDDYAEEIIDAYVAKLDVKHISFALMQCCGSGSGIRCLFLTPVSGMGEKSRSGSGSGINIPDHIS
jgi:hypothetical protein